MGAPRCGLLCLRAGYASTLSAFRVLSGADEAEFHLFLKGRNRVAMEQRDLAVRVVEHPIDAGRRNEIAGVDDEMLHCDSLANRFSCIRTAQVGDGSHGLINITPLRLIRWECWPALTKCIAFASQSE